MCEQTSWFRRSPRLVSPSITFLAASNVPLNTDLSMKVEAGSNRRDNPFHQAGLICLNASYVRLAAAKLMDYGWAASLRFEDLIKLKLFEESREPHLISTSAARDVIYATPNM